MTEDAVRLAAVGAVARRRWRPLLALTIVGGLIGFGLSFLLSPGYEAASKALLLGSRAKAQVATETQIAMSLGVLDRAVAELGWNRTGSELQGSVSAQVLDGNVIEIRAAAETPERARQLADVVTSQYIAFSTQIATDTSEATADATKRRRDSVQARIDDLAKRIDAAERDPVAKAAGPDGDQARVALDQLRSAHQGAVADLTAIDRQNTDSNSNGDETSGPITVLEPAQLRGAAAPTPAQLVAGGAAGLALIGLFTMMRATRSDARLRGAAGIASALGAPVITSVVMRPDEEQVASARQRSWLARLLSDEARWTPSMALLGDDAHEESRYRRVLRIVGADGGSPLRLLVVVPVDDALARRTVAHLARSCAAFGRPVTVLTDNPVLADLIRDSTGPADRIDVAAPSTPPNARSTMRVVDVVPGRPTVPEWDQTATSLVVLSDGSRTAWELVGIAGACFDAGSPVTGVVLAELGPALDPPVEATSPEPQPSAQSNGASVSDRS